MENTTKTLTEQLPVIFNALNISVTGHEVKLAEEVIAHCKQYGADAYGAAYNIVVQLELPQSGNILPLKQSLIAHGIFKN